MRVIKLIATVLLCTVLGVGIGAGIFYGQQYVAKRSTSQVKASTTTDSKSTTTTSTLAQFKSPQTNISFNLPENTVVLETSVSDLSNLISGITQTLYTLEKTTNSLTETGIQVTSLANSGATTSAFTTASKKLETQRTTGKLLSQTLESTTTGGLSVTQKSYLGTAGGNDVLAEIATNDMYIQIFIPSTTTLSEQALSDFIASIKETTAPSASPSALLNSPNE